MPQSNPGGIVTYSPPFEVAPQTLIATWTDVQGIRQISQGPATDMDVLAFLGASGADTSNAQVIAEAQQLHALVDGLTKGNNTYTLKGFSSGGSGSGSSQRLGPIWFPSVYAGVWFLIWVIGLIVIGRRGRRTYKS